MELSLTTVLIVAAVGTFVGGFLFRDQVQIRALVVLGSIIYIIYYATAGPEPLWDAIVGSVLIGLASLQGLIHILWGRTRFAVPPNTSRVLERMGSIEPGLFRQLIRAATRLEVTEPLVLVREERLPDTLWFVVSGKLALQRQGHEIATINGPCFIGEVAWLRGAQASATVTALEGTELVRWRHDELRRVLRKSQRLELALDALIAQDLARKVATSKPLVSLAADDQTSTTNPRPGGP